MILKEILDPQTKKHLRFDNVDETTDLDLVAQQKWLADNADALAENARKVEEARTAEFLKRQIARDNLVKIKVKGLANWSQTDYQLVLINLIDWLGI